VAEHPLDDDDVLAVHDHLDGDRVAQLVRRAALAHAGGLRELGHLVAHPLAAPRRDALRAALDDAQQRPGRQVVADAHPRLEDGPQPVVEADGAALPPLPRRTNSSPVVGVEVGLVQRERFAAAQPGAPREHDERAQPLRVALVLGHVADVLEQLQDLGTVGGVAGSAGPCWQVSGRRCSPARSRATACARALSTSTAAGS
jgi:hypothetical protein